MDHKQFQPTTGRVRHNFNLQYIQAHGPLLQQTKIFKENLSTREQSSLEIVVYPLPEIAYIRCQMGSNSSTCLPTMLSSDDLEEINRFHVAWCEENNVEKTDPRAIEVASALISWYSTSPAYRQRAKLDHPPELPNSQHIETLLERLRETR
ncbi:hypothetical protein [Agrobacterium rubi]|uniref:Uncharacterized protein n=1 Tax=Agrobacterium rubi TaxID=28099 RepID=A0ABX2J706_9HYPH|nr:hypothetical protein [Agrobacterium rubi]NTE88044.1 hypothetical protein [Agrobacterium rubi]NTF03811.1 hypothetical protein [Agrobacterium rubi]NTF38138.1 hypothetical protein [Agrobacterium rubi]